MHTDARKRHTHNRTHTHTHIHPHPPTHSPLPLPLPLPLPPPTPIHTHTHHVSCHVSLLLSEHHVQGGHSLHAQLWGVLLRALLGVVHAVKVVT